MIGVIGSTTCNLASVANSLKRLQLDFVISSDKKALDNCECYILPGVGAVAELMDFLRQNELVDFIKGNSRPILGICLGMQVLFDFSKEGDQSCLGIISGEVAKIKESISLPVPHMGWNQVSYTKEGAPLFEGIPQRSYFYFVHSYKAQDLRSSVALCDYGCSVVAAVNRNQFWGVQFHPEKSSKWGQKLILNFSKIKT